MQIIIGKNENKRAYFLYSALEIFIFCLLFIQIYKIRSNKITKLSSDFVYNNYTYSRIKRNI